MRLAMNAAAPSDDRHHESGTGVACRHTLNSRHHLRRRLLCACLAMALGKSASAGLTNALPPDIPLQWPLPHGRGGETTPLRSRLDAMRLPPQVGSPHAPRQWLVENCADDDSVGSLRSVIEQADSGDVIDLRQLTCSRISLSQGALKLELSDLTLLGPGAAQLTLSGENRDRIILHPGSGTLTIEDLTIAHGEFHAVDNDIGFGGCIATGASLVLRRAVVRDCMAVGVGAYGGAVLSGFMTMINSTISDSTAFGDHPANGTAAYGGGAFSYGVEIFDSTISGNTAIGTDNAPLTHWEIAGGLFVARNGGLIERSTISDNFAIRFAGGLAQEGDLTLRNSTISGNLAETDDGGGIRVRQDTALRIENCTIANNHAGSVGGGISFVANARPSTLISSIVAGNSSGFGNADLDSALPLSIAGSHNLVVQSGKNLQLPADTLHDDPLLLPLAANGGATRTHALSPSSPALDRGSNPNALLTDQRGEGYAREVGLGTDIGAVELQGQGAEPIALSGLRSWGELALAAILALLGVHRARRQIDRSRAKGS